MPALKAEQLDARLKKGLEPLYVLVGEEPLLALEAADTLRAAAKAAGYTERQVFSSHQHFDWGQLAAANAGMSLFGDKPLIDLTVPTGKPGKEGAQALKDYCARLDDGAVTLISLPKLEREQKSSTWFTALEEAGVTITFSAIERDQLPGWIDLRLKRQGQSADAPTLQFIADRVEGNLLAAHQEIQKMGLLFAPGKLEFDAVQEAVLNVARYDTFKLNETWLAGDLSRFRRTLEGLKGEGEAPPLVLWAMADEIRALAKMRSKKGYVPFRGQKMQMLRERVVGALRPGQLGAALAHAHRIDRIIKGVGPQDAGTVWDEFFELGRRFCGG
jgi:DNA polymerase III subunit delta